MLAVSSADARVGGGLSSGSREREPFPRRRAHRRRPARRSRSTAPSRNPGSPGVGGSTGGGFFNSPGRGLLGGLAAGFLGAGLLGMLFGGGMFSGLGGLSSILGLILQIGLIIVVVRLAMSWWQRRHATAPAYAGAAPAYGAPSSMRTATGFGLDRAARRLRSFQPIMKPSNDCSGRFRPHGRTRMSPNCIPWRHLKWCRISPKILRPTRPRTTSTRPPTSSCCRAISRKPGAEGDTDYASVAMRFSLVDKTIERTTGRLVEGSDQPIEVTEVWTFVRPRGASWELSAIQQV